MAVPGAPTGRAGPPPHPLPLTAASRVAPPARGQRHPGPRLAAAAEPPEPRASAAGRGGRCRRARRGAVSVAIRRRCSPRGARGCPAPSRPVPSHGGGDAPLAALPADPSLLIRFRRFARRGIIPRRAPIPAAAPSLGDAAPRLTLLRAPELLNSMSGDHLTALSTFQDQALGNYSNSLPG
ncbi:atherin-like [Camarhynchus parvulus]|uniref:atherin-like n=1 Tax=Geospiza parvula TaxID=87175 RepID=UPI001237EE90|nr:atherin-like [Camarhynchus parvulus]